MSNRTCSIEDCNNSQLARGWCNKHYKRWSIHGDPLALAPPPPTRLCGIDDCANKHQARGWCKKHLTRWERHGTPDGLWKKCWVWGCSTETRGQLGLCHPHRARDRLLRKKYGIDLRQYDELSWKQRGCCAICGAPEQKTLHVDHDHDTGAIRGLLCANCNLGIGHIRNPDHLCNAARYLSKGDI